MGTIQTSSPAASSLANALFPKVRQRVLVVLFGMPESNFYANQVIVLAQSGTGAVQRQLAALAEAGLLTVSKQGNQKHFQANTAAPVFTELRGLIIKTMGLADVLRVALAPLALQIEAAFVYGSAAKQQDADSINIDLMIVSPSLGYADVYGALESACATLGRPIKPTLHTPVELTKRIAQDNAFVTHVLQQPKIWLIGTEEQLNAQPA